MLAFQFVFNTPKPVFSVIKHTYHVQKKSCDIVFQQRQIHLTGFVLQFFRQSHNPNILNQIPLFNLNTITCISNRFCDMDFEAYGKYYLTPSINNIQEKACIPTLWVAYHDDKPVQYSRSPNSYGHSRRYGKLHFKYNRVIPIIDTNNISSSST